MRVLRPAVFESLRVPHLASLFASFCLLLPPFASAPLVRAVVQDADEDADEDADQDAGQTLRSLLRVYVRVPTPIARQWFPGWW